MDSYIVEKIRENLAEVEPDAAAFAAVIANHSALTGAVCAMSGIERERLQGEAKRLVGTEHDALYCRERRGFDDYRGAREQKHRQPEPTACH